IYKRYIKPDASDRSLVRASYLSSALVVGVGILFGFLADSVHQMTQWIVFGLYGGYTAPNILKWHWWRFNGYGYFWGMISGVIAALAYPFVLPNMHDIYSFPIILAISLAGCIIGTLRTDPDDEEVLKEFYRRVRPWGFWKPIHEKVVAENPSFENRSNWKLDMVNVFVGVVWQTALRIIPIFIIIYEFKWAWVSVLLVAVTTVILKKNWYDKLEDD
ncbi:MAG: sodium:solute symporter, partial [Calditrichaeota bacterium]|nr:sodium:solute symporter [Calditrichota bacterium]